MALTVEKQIERFRKGYTPEGPCNNRDKKTEPPCGGCYPCGRRREDYAYGLLWKAEATLRKYRERK